MDDRPNEEMLVLAHGAEDGIDWAVCAAPLPGANGYVRIPEGHTWAGVPYDEIPVEAPGGLTYSSNGWIGFDTLHLGDGWSDEELDRLEELGANWRDRRYRRYEDPSIHWSIELIIEETKRLARHVAAYQDELEKTIESIKRSFG